MTQHSGGGLLPALGALAFGLLAAYACLGYVMAGMLGAPEYADARAAAVWAVVAVISGIATIRLAALARRRRRGRRTSHDR